MGAELARKRAGKPTKTNMSEAQLKDFASTKRANLPVRKMNGPQMKVAKKLKRIKG